MANKVLKITVGPSTSSEGENLEATFTVPDLAPSLPHTWFDGALADGTPVKVEQIEAPSL